MRMGIDSERKVLADLCATQGQRLCNEVFDEGKRAGGVGGMEFEESKGDV